jgi:hypothetical protein
MILFWILVDIKKVKIKFNNLLLLRLLLTLLKRLLKLNPLEIRRPVIRNLLKARLYQRMPRRMLQSQHNLQAKRPQRAKHHQSQQPQLRLAQKCHLHHQLPARARPHLLHHQQAKPHHLHQPVRHHHHLQLARLHHHLQPVKLHHHLHQKRNDL